jgi:THO complex subunit 1
MPVSKKKKQTKSDAKQQHFFAKYLTSFNLFELELNDPSFRRQFLFQFLIVTQFLTQYASKELGLEGGNKSMQYSFKFTSDQEKWLTSSKLRATSIIEKIIPGGRNFFKFMGNIIVHDKNWIQWKADSCQSYELPPYSQTDIKKKRKIDGSLSSDSKFLGNEELSLLWERGSNVNQTLLVKKIR